MPSPQKLNLRKMYNVFTEIDDGKTKNLYFADDFGIVIEATDILRPFIESHQGPFMLEDYRIIICKKGSIHTIINLQEYTIEEGMMAIIVPGTIIEPIAVSKDSIVTGIGFSEERMLLALQHNLPDTLRSQRQNIFFTPTEQERLLAEQLFDTIWALANEKITSETTLNAMLGVITHAYSDMFSRHTKDTASSSAPHSRQHEIFQRFIALVNAHCREQRQLDFYADRLCITRRHLGTVIHSASGVTAKEWVDRAVITSAKVLLRHSDKSVSQISDELHFPNDSFFCKYFHQLTGTTPLDWRKSH